MFCAALQDQGHTFLYTFSLDEIGKEILKGPFALRISEPVLSLFSVYDQVIASTNSHLLIVSLTGDLVKVPTPSPITCYLPYSDQCTRILLGGNMTLFWLHIKGKQVSVATAVPIMFRDILSLGSTNAGLVTIALYGGNTKSLVLRINLKTQEIAKVCEIPTAKTVIESTSLHRNLTTAVIRNGDSRELRVYSPAIQLTHTSFISLEDATNVHTVERDLWLVTSKVGSWSTLYQLTKTGLKPSSSIGFTSTVATQAVYAVKGTYYQVSASQLTICNSRGRKDETPFPFHTTSAAGVTTSTGDFQVLVAHTNRIYRANDGKFVCELRSAIAALAGEAGHLYVLGSDGAVEVLREHAGWWVQERSWSADLAADLIISQDSLFLPSTHYIEIRSLDFALQKVIPISPGKVKLLSNSSFLLRSKENASILNIKTGEIVPFPESVLDASLSDSMLFIIEKRGLTVGELHMEVREHTLAGGLIGVTDRTVAVLTESEVQFYALPHLQVPSVCCALTCTQVTALLAQDSDLLLVVNSVDLQLHKCSPGNTLVRQVTYAQPILALRTHTEGWVVLTQFEVSFFDSMLEEMGPKIHHETEEYQKLRLAQDQDCIQDLVSHGFLSKYESIIDVKILPSDSRSEVVVTLTEESLYMCTWTHAAVNVKTRLKLSDIGVQGKAALEVMGDLLAVKETATGKIWLGKVKKEVNTRALCNSLYTDPVAYSVTGTFIETDALKGLVRGPEGFLVLQASGQLVPLNT